NFLGPLNVLGGFLILRSTMVEPTAYDLEQDSRIESLESLITAEYEPPSGVEYSYPVSNQGITQTQFRNMMRALGKGTITQHNTTTAQSSYRLEAHASDAETNQRNTLLLRPAPSFNQAETASNGFFHVLTEAMELPFPSVTSKPTYHVCVTYDPRKFKTDPLKIEVYPGTPPTSEGRDHVVLFTVKRSPNQLLSQAGIGRGNQWLGHVINAWSYNELPDPTHVEYGTLAVVRIPSREAGARPERYASKGVHGWAKIRGPADNEWATINGKNGWTSGPAKVRHTPLGLQLAGYLNNTSGQQNEEFRIGELPEGYRANYQFRGSAQASTGIRPFRVQIEDNGSIYYYRPSGISLPGNICLDGIIIPYTAGR